MKSFIAFFRKECMEEVRSGRFFATVSLFLLFGIMNPAIAKITPWLLEIMADSLLESGMIVTDIKISAMDSWVQFFKNIPIGLIAFVLLQGSIFTKEYDTGTLVLSLTKGARRVYIILSKVFVLVVLWSFSYWLCFCITYLYNSYFWDNSVANNLGLAVFCQWLFGMFVISLTTIFSTLSSSFGGVLLGTGGTVVISYAVGLIPKINEYLPTRLFDGNSLIYGASEPRAYIPSLITTAAVGLALFTVSIPIFNKREL